jgi:hypothetical protein
VPLVFSVFGGALSLPPLLTNKVISTYFCWIITVAEFVACASFTFSSLFIRFLRRKLTLSFVSLFFVSSQFDCIPVRAHMSDSPQYWNKRRIVCLMACLYVFIPLGISTTLKTFFKRMSVRIRADSSSVPHSKAHEAPNLLLAVPSLHIRATHIRNDLSKAFLNTYQFAPVFCPDRHFGAQGASAPEPDQGGAAAAGLAAQGAREGRRGEGHARARARRKREAQGKAVQK